MNARAKHCTNSGPKHWRARLTTAQVDAIRDAYEKGEGGYRYVAKCFGVPWTTVRDICRYRNRCRG